MSLFRSNHDSRQGTLIHSILNYWTGAASKIFKRPAEQDVYLGSPKRIRGTEFNPAVKSEIRQSGHRWRNNKITHAFFKLIEDEWMDSIKHNGSSLTVINLCPGFAQNTVMQREIISFIKELEQEYKIALFENNDDDKDGNEVLLLVNSPKPVSNKEIFEMYTRVGKGDLKIGLCISNQETINIVHTSPPLPLGVHYHRLGFDSKSSNEEEKKTPLPKQDFMKNLKTVACQTAADDVFTPTSKFNFTSSSVDEEEECNRSVVEGQQKPTPVDEVNTKKIEYSQFMEKVTLPDFIDEFT